MCAACLATAKFARQSRADVVDKLMVSMFCKLSGSANLLKPGLYEPLSLSLVDTRKDAVDKDSPS